jgi:hypothetical protein
MSFLKMSEIVEREISWLMYPYIPFGMVTNIFGDKFIGKTQLASAIISAATGSQVLHGQEMPNVPISVLLQIPEDSFSNVKLRLTKCGANCDLIDIVPFELNYKGADIKMLKDAIKDTGSKLFVLDPLDLYLHHASEEEYFSCVRRFSHLAASTGCAVLLVSDELPVSVQEIVHS